MESLQLREVFIFLEVQKAAFGRLTVLSWATVSYGKYQLLQEGILIVASCYSSVSLNESMEMIRVSILRVKITAAKEFAL